MLIVVLSNRIAFRSAQLHACSVPFFNYELKFLQTQFSAILLLYFM